MTYTVITLIFNISILLAVFLLSRRRQSHQVVVKYVKDKKTRGLLDKMYIRAVIAEKTAEKAFSLASASSLGVMALQKSLAVPRPLTKTQLVQNELAKKQVDGLFSQEGSFDWIRPLLSEEENAILDDIEKKKH